MRDVDKAGVDAPSRDARDGASDAKPAKRKAARAMQAGGEASSGIAPWFSGAGLRRRMPLNADQGNDAAIAGADAEQRRHTEASSRRTPMRGASWLTGAASAAVVMLAVCAPLLITQLAPAEDPAAGGYLGFLRMQYEQTASGSGGMPPDASPALTATMAACAAAAGVPPAVVPGPGLPRATPDHAASAAAAAAADPLSRLDLDCAAPDGPGACSSVAESTNHYEDGLPEARVDLAGYLAGWEAYAANLAAAERTGSLATGAIPSDLDSLALDCDTEPAACEAAAAASNSYEEGAESAAAAAAAVSGARQHLEALDATAAASPSPDSLDSLALDCESPADAAACAVAAAVNHYEGDGEHPLERMRIAEQAMPGSLPVDALGLDCWGPAQDGTLDPITAAECARSRGTNRYEIPRSAAAHGHAHRHSHGASGLPIDVAIASGPDGLPVSGLVEGEYSWISKKAAARAAGLATAAAAARGGAYHEATDLVAARRAADIQQRRDAEAWFARNNRRAQGKPLVAEPESVAAQELPADQPAASEAPEMYIDKPRLYFKNPCNNPSTRKYYKSLKNDPHLHEARIYYKSPANVPSHYAAPAGGAAASAGANPLVQPQVAMALWAGIVGAAVLVYLQRGRTSAPAEEETATGGDAVANDADLPPGDDDSSCRAVATGSPLKVVLAAGSPSPRRATPGGPLRLAQDSGDVDVVPSGTMDSPRRAGGTPRGGTPLFGRSTTPLGRVATPLGRLGPQHATPEVTSDGMD